MAEVCPHDHNARASCPCIAAARIAGRAEVSRAAQLPLSHAHSERCHAARSSAGPARRVADRRDAISCAAASASAGYGRKRRLTPLGRSSTICRPCSEAAHLGIKFRQGIAHPAERQLPPCLSAEAPAGRYRWSCCIHRPCHSAPPGSLVANLVARHSTPNSTARRPAPTVSRAYARTQVGRSSYNSTVPAGARQAA